MVEPAEILTMKKEHVFDHINHLADTAKTDNFMKEQMDITHPTSPKKQMFQL